MLDLSTSMQMALAAGMAELHQKIKDSDAPLVRNVRNGAGAANKYISAALALLSTLGLQAAFAIDPASGWGSFTLGHIPVTYDQWSTVFMTALTQYWLQKFYFKTALARPSPSEPLRG